MADTRELVNATESGEHWYRLWCERGAEVERLQADWQLAIKIAEQHALEVERLRTALQDEYTGHEAYVDNVPCDAGNFDGGNPRDCEHCQHQRRLEVISRILQRDAN